MIQKFVTRFDEKREDIKAAFKAKAPDNYKEIVKVVIEAISTEYGDPDPEKIHLIDDGHYQGTLLFIIPEKGYQPSTYWSVMVGYGSCSGCDTLESISNYSSEPPTEQQVNDYFTLALHILQGLKEI